MISAQRCANGLRHAARNRRGAYVVTTLWPGGYAAGQFLATRNERFLVCVIRAVPNRRWRCVHLPARCADRAAVAGARGAVPGGSVENYAKKIQPA